MPVNSIFTHLVFNKTFVGLFYILWQVAENTNDGTCVSRSCVIYFTFIYFPLLEGGVAAIIGSISSLAHLSKFCFSYLIYLFATSINLRIRCLVVADQKEWEISKWSQSITNYIFEILQPPYFYPLRYHLFTNTTSPYYSFE